MQSSAALLERQRNPGVGYWAAKPDGSSETRSPISSVSDLPRDSPSRPSSPATGKSDEEVNYEYLRNVILQFLEHKEMRVSPSIIRCIPPSFLILVSATFGQDSLHDTAVHSPGNSTPHCQGRLLSLLLSASVALVSSGSAFEARYVSYLWTTTILWEAM